MRELRIGRAAVLGAIMLAVIAWAPSAPAKNSKCLILGSGHGANHRSLQSAVDDAEAGATLRVRGTCIGTTTIDKNLTITGQHHPKGFTSPTLDGDQQGSVLTVEADVTATVNSLTITGGTGTVTFRDRLSGGGILNAGTLTLNETTVTDNTSGEAPFSFGAGAGITSFGILTLNESIVSDNTAQGPGGGIANVGTLTLNNSMVTGNAADGFFNSVGGGITNEGSVTLNGTSRVSGNTAILSGGGIANFNVGGMVTLNGSSTVSGNAAFSGGGIYNAQGTLVNCVPGAGGNVFGNTPDDIFIES